MLKKYTFCSDGIRPVRKNQLLEFLYSSEPVAGLSQRFPSGREPVVSESWSERTCSFKNVNPTTDCRPIEAELAGHVHELDVTLQSFVVVAFLCLLCTCLSSLATLE